MSSIHGAPSEGMTCQCCWEDIDTDLYVEYKASAGSVVDHLLFASKCSCICKPYRLSGLPWSIRLTVFCGTGTPTYAFSNRVISNTMPPC
jgi:hypothetical protein